jgi:predicted GNAT family N-acyltransferase
VNTNVFKGLYEQRWGPSESVHHPRGWRLWVRRPEPDEFPLLHHLLVTEITAEASSVETMTAVFSHNRDSFWVIVCEKNGEEARPVGFFASLALNKNGVTALRSGRFDARHPDFAQIVPTGVDPEALYLWGVVARGMLALTIPLVGRAMGPRYRSAPLYASIATEGGRQALMSLGFTDVAGANPRIGSLMRRAPLLREDGLPAEMKHRIRTCVASNAEQLQQVFAVRAAVYMSEQNCPYEEEFDGNDYCATHVLGFVDDKPCAAARVRYFANFAKLERLAVLRDSRGTHVARAVVESAHEVCRRKGYTHVYGHAQARLLDFWAKFGFRLTQRNARLVYSDHEYVEVVAELTPHESPITLESDPYLIVRPEGAWDSPGILEKSGIRPATNPH